MARFVNNTFDADSFHTIGVEFLNKELTIDGKYVSHVQRKFLCHRNNMLADHVTFKSGTQPAKNGSEVW
jgi:hypothetical protein